MADRLVFRLGEHYFGLDTAMIDGIVETDQVFFLPGSSGFIKGIIGLRGEAVTVVDGGILDADQTLPDQNPRKIVVIRERGRLIGIDIGGAEVSFVWGEAKTDTSGVVAATSAIPAGEIKPVDCTGIFNTAEKVLSPGHKRVVIADDMEFFRSAIRGILTRAGFSVIAEAHNGDEAVEMVEVLKPDIVILDVVMPVKNGIDAATEINKLRDRPKIVMCSSLDDKPVVDGAIRAGADAYIKKPLNRTDIIDTLYGLNFGK